MPNLDRPHTSLDHPAGQECGRCQTPVPARRVLTADDVEYVYVCQAQAQAYVWGRHDARGYGGGDSAAFGLAWSEYTRWQLTQAPRGGMSRPAIQDAYAAFRAGLPIGTGDTEVSGKLRELGIFAELFPLAPEVLSAAIGKASAPGPASEPESGPESRCQGHESLAGAHMGEAVYCDGTCEPDDDDSEPDDSEPDDSEPDDSEPDDDAHQDTRERAHDDAHQAERDAYWYHSA